MAEERIAAGALRIDRSRLANQILADALKRYRLQDLGPPDGAKPDGKAIGSDPPGE